jgi:diguanylate cyclase (GGDEF)-like protein
VICPATPLDGARQLAERIRVAVETNRIELPAYQGNVTVSLGVASRSEERSPSIDALLKGADEAVYQAKNLGRNRVAIAADGHEKRASA